MLLVFLLKKISITPFSKQQQLDFMVK
jgi:hypothetical protein